MKLIACSSNPLLAKNIADHLKITLSEISIKRFADSEIFVELLENVRGEDVFVVQSISAPSNDNLMELLLILDALKRGSAQRITACIPYFGYTRQDRKTGPRTPISAKLVADLLTAAGANRILTLDLHAAQIQGFFNIPVDNLYAMPLFSKDISKNFSPVDSETIVVSPDIGGVMRARLLANRLSCELAVIDKRRNGPGDSYVSKIIGDVQGKKCLITDDIVDSGGTLYNAAQALTKAGALSIHAYVTHGVFSGQSIDLLNKAPLEQIVITDSIHTNHNSKNCSKIRQIPLAPLFGEAIHRINCEKSVSLLFN